MSIDGGFYLLLITSALFGCKCSVNKRGMSRAVNEHVKCVSNVDFTLELSFSLLNLNKALKSIKKRRSHKNIAYEHWFCVTVFTGLLSRHS